LYDRRGHLVPIKRQLIRWTTDNQATLRTTDDPVMPEKLRGRAGDNWRPLIAICDVVGGDWPDRGRAVAEKMSGYSEQALAVMLLEDCAIAFAAKGVDRFSSKELCDILNEREDRPWPEFKLGKPLTQRQLASLLDAFDLAPGSVRGVGGKAGTAKGYRLE